MLFTQKSDSEYDRHIRRILREMEIHEPGSDEFSNLIDRLQKLQKMRSDDRPDRINPNTVLQVAANIVGIAIIVRHEQLNVITTKALGFVMKAR